MKKVRIGSKNLPAWLVLLAGLITAMGLGTLGYILWHWGPHNWGVVEPGRIYRSGLLRPGHVKQVLADNHIGVVISLCPRNPKDARDVALEKAVEELGLEIQRFPMHGNGTPNDGTINWHVAAVAAIVKARKEGKPVLVQCAAGAQRTGGVVATYQLLVERKSPQEVYAEMCRHKFNAARNPKLLEFLNRHMKDIAEKLVSLGVIEDVPAVATIPGEAGEAQNP